MSAYSELSNIYSTFMEDAPYAQWEEWLTKNYSGLKDLDVVDIGCGTGTFTVPLALRCKSVIGVDLSDDMLARAAEFARSERVAVQWMCQDMRSLRLPKLVDMAISTCDCVNYLLRDEDVEAAFLAVNKALKPGGYWLFDTLGAKRIEVLKEFLSYDLRDDAAIMFESHVDDENLITYDVHAFVEEDSGLYRRFTEKHYQRYHSYDTLKHALEISGFQLEFAYGDFGACGLDSADRFVFVARKL